MEGTGRIPEAMEVGWTWQRTACQVRKRSGSQDQFRDAGAGRISIHWASTHERNEDNEKGQQKRCLKIFLKIRRSPGTLPNSIPFLLSPGATALMNLWHLQSALFVQHNGRSSILQVCPSSPL